MTLRGIEQTARALTYYARLQDVTANNLANMTTDGFKLDRMTAAAATTGSFPVPVQSLDLAQGRLKETGRELDVALDGQGFLVVQTPQGDRLSRGGTLRLDDQGRLATGDGHPVLGEDGVIVVPPGRLEIDQDGTVRVDGDRIDRLRLENTKDATTLLKEGGTRFTSPAGTEPAGEGLKVLQGRVEEPNGDPLHGMIDLITIQRAYSANVDALKAMDHVLGTIASDIARV